MKAITTTISFKLQTNEVATIEQDYTGTWGFTTNSGYNTWEGDLYKSFDKCYAELKKYEKRNVAEKNQHAT